MWSGVRTLTKGIHYISKSGKISNDSIAGLAQERDFYKLEKIEPDELALIEAHFTHVHPSLKKAHQKRLDLYKRRYEKLELIRKKGSHIPGVEAFVEWCTYNLIEGENSAIETYARPVLDALVKGNLSILDKRENYVNFTKFLSLQLTRTKALRDKFTRALRADNSPDSLKLANLIEKHWWYLYFMFGDNISTDFIHNSDSYRCTMCTNRTGIEFITSDCPVANIHPQPTVEMINYYPLSPERAFIISNTEEFPVHREINTDEEVDFLNRKIVAAAYENVFASNAEILNRYRPHYLNTRQ